MLKLLECSCTYTKRQLTPEFAVSIVLVVDSCVNFAQHRLSTQYILIIGCQRNTYILSPVKTVLTATRRASISRFSRFRFNFDVALVVSETPDGREPVSSLSLAPSSWPSRIDVIISGSSISEDEHFKVN